MEAAQHEQRRRVAREGDDAMSNTNHVAVDPRTSFLADVRRNLHVVGCSHGQYSSLYGDLVCRYREVAAALGCLHELEHVVQSLPAVARRGQQRRLSQPA